MRRILCDDEFGTRVFAHVLDDGTIDYLREKTHRVMVFGDNFTLIGTNPQGDGRTVIVVKDVKLVEEGLRFKGEDDGQQQKTDKSAENEQVVKPDAKSDDEPEA